MSRPTLASHWTSLRARGRVAFIPYITSGFPDAQQFGSTLDATEALGADIVEVGVPFTDPVADGPTIQRSCQVALANRTTVRSTLERVRSSPIAIPIVLFTYLNPVLAYGVEDFVRDAADAGVGAVLFTDLPAGADPRVEQVVSDSPLDLIRLVAPTTTDRRLGEVLNVASGFIYLVSRLGVTGARDALPESLAEAVARVRAQTDLPIAVGFGVSSGAQAATVAEVADGVVVGSALVDALALRGVDGFRHLMADLRRGIDRRVEVGPRNG